MLNATSDYNSPNKSRSGNAKHPDSLNKLGMKLGFNGLKKPDKTDRRRKYSPSTRKINIYMPASTAEVFLTSEWAADPSTHETSWHRGR